MHFAPELRPAIAGPLTFLVEYGHLLIGLSLVFGLFVRLSGPFAILLLLLYWTAHMDFPYIETHQWLMIDFHLVFAALTAWLVMADAGRIWGLDGWLAERRAPQGHAVA